MTSAKRRILVGLIGRNIQGSLSPALFADAFAAARMEGFYHLIDADRLPGRRLPELLDTIKAAGFAGANITCPFKQDILPLLDAVDPEAAQVGAINTVAIADGGRSTGYNFNRRGRVTGNLERDIAAADGIVNATQTGMTGFPGNPVPVAAIKPTHWAADVIYTPVETEFLKAAAAKGARTLNGGGMCVHQAVAAFRLFTGVEADAARMHRAFAQGLAAREGAT